METIDYNEFLKASHIVNQLVYEDLKWFVEGGWEDLRTSHPHGEWDNQDGFLSLHEAGDIATTGLVEIVSPEITVRDQDDWKINSYYDK